MSCETYREALIEAAASGTQPPAAISAHLQGCAGCRAALEREQFLFASIDSSLRAAANADVPPSFLAQVRAQLNHHQVVRRRFWAPAWTAIATAAALALLIVLIHNPKRGASGQVSKENVVANSASRVERSPAPPVHPAERAPQATRSKRIRSAKIRLLAPFEHVSVLVPSGQKQAIDALLSAMQRGTVKPEVLLTEKPQQPLQGLQVSPLDISPIEVKPLADVSGDSRTEAEKTKL
jgi:hypothetical protein